MGGLALTSAGPRREVGRGVTLNASSHPSIFSPHFKREKIMAKSGIGELAGAIRARLSRAMVLENMLMDEGGFLDFGGDWIKWLIISGIVGAVMIFLTFNFKYVVALAAIIVIGLMVFGAVFGKGKIKIKEIMPIALICLGIVLFVSVTPAIAIGIILIGGTLYFFSPAKYPALFVVLIGVGCLMALYGSIALKSLGIFP